MKSLPNNDEYILTQLMRTLYATTSEGKSLIYKETKEKLMQDNKCGFGCDLPIYDNDVCNKCYNEIVEGETK
jgi:hypothetical protein